MKRSTKVTISRPEPPSTSQSLFLSSFLFVVLLSILELTADFWQSSRTKTVLGGLLCSFLFSFALIAIGNIFRMIDSKRISWPSVFVSLCIAAISAASIHRVCATTCVLFSLLQLYALNRVSTRLSID